MLPSAYDTDHVMLYIDFDEDLLFKGIMNHLVLKPSREFVIEHADKAEKFVTIFRELAEEKKFKERALSQASKGLWHTWSKY